jgi:hypothetical protein
MTPLFERLMIGRRKGGDGVSAGTRWDETRRIMRHAVADSVSVSATLLPAGSELSYIRNSCA